MLLRYKRRTEAKKPRLKASDSSLHEQRPSNSSGLAENFTVSKKALRAYFLYNVYLFLWPQVSSVCHTIHFPFDCCSLSLMATKTSSCMQHLFYVAALLSPNEANNLLEDTNIGVSRGHDN